MIILSHPASAYHFLIFRAVSPRLTITSRQLISGRIYILERDGEKIPVPSDLTKLVKTLQPMQAIALIDVNMQIFSAIIKGRSVNKMCTIPAWLAYEGKEAGINFSQTLQEALIQKLGVNHKIPV